MHIISRVIAKFLPMGQDGRFSSTRLRQKASLYIAPNLLGTAVAAFLYGANVGPMRIIDAAAMVLLAILTLAAIAAILRLHRPLQGIVRDKIGGNV